MQIIKVAALACFFAVSAAMAVETLLPVEPKLYNPLDENRIPCPDGWIVEVNPAIENSLTYTHEDLDLSVNVTYIADTVSKSATPEAFARVSAQQLNCQMPVHSNLIDKAWSFTCDDFESEAVIYGEKADLVMLTISGRNSKTEQKLESFIKFLDYQSTR